MNNIFKEINYESAYILGFYWADGNLTNNSLDIEIQEQDKYLLDKFNEIICNSKNKIYRRDRNNSICYRLVITNKNIAASLRELGYGNKNNRIIPKIDEEYIYSFIRGYFDGDGSVSVRNKKSFTEFRLDIAGRKDFIEFIEKYLPIPPYSEIIEWKTCASKRIYYRKKDSIINILKLLTVNDTIKLERKYTLLH